MKKFYLLLLLPLLGVGCVQKPVVLQAPKEKIISYQVIHFPERTLLGAATSTTSTIKLPPKDEVEYTYISDEVTTRTPYFEKGNNISSAEYLRSNKLTMAFYGKPKFYKELGTVFNVKSATTTLANFQKVNKITFIEKIRGFFIDTAVATSTFNTSSTYNPVVDGTVEYLLVGGGGGAGAGGGPNFNGAGGGGGVVTGTVAIVAGSYPIVVGVGGVGCPDCTPAFRGSSSTFNGFVAGGGYPAFGTAHGGDSGNGFLGAAVATPQGGGGGGAGGDASGNAGGRGASSTASGADVCYGGGGAGQNAGTATCGGGAGSNPTANRGGGGSWMSSGAGADGVVILALTTSTAGTTVVSGGTQWFFSQD